MSLRDFGASLLRTAVPVVVGLILAGLAKAQIQVDEATLATVIDGLAIGGYYTLLRLLETRWPQLGWLLGWAIAPQYGPDADYLDTDEE